MLPLTNRSSLPFVSPIAVILALAVLMWSTGFPFVLRKADAAALSNVSDTLSDSDLGVSSNHTIRFTNYTALVAANTITVTFQSGFVIPEALGVDDIDFFAGTERTLATSSAPGVWGVAIATTTRTITLTAGSGETVASTTAMTIEIGSNATSTATGNNFITNPGSSGSYTVAVQTTSDSTVARVYIIDDVVVTAAVDSVFTFLIEGVSTSTVLVTSAAVTDRATTTDTSTAVALPFGTLVSGTAATLGQRISVTTNAANGYNVTLIQDQNLTSQSGADIDLFSNGATSSTPISWSSPANTPGSDATFGHFGITSSDALTTGTSATSSSAAEWDPASGPSKWAGNFNSAREVLYHNDPTNGLSGSNGEGWAYVGFRIQIGSLQEAATDYTNTITYVATPIF